MKICGIYKIISPSGRVYVGQSIDIKDRWRQYRTLNKSVKKNVKLYKSFLKYGVESHVFEIVEECILDELNNRERYWQEFYNTVDDGLNCLFVETSEKRKIMSQEVRDKISKNNARYWKGKKKPIEVVEKMVKNRIYTDEYRRKIGDKSKGRKHSDETRKKISESNIGKKRSKEFSLKMSLINKGRKRSADQIEKRRIRIKESPMSKNTKIKISESLKKYYLEKRNENKKNEEFNIHMYCSYTNELLKSFNHIYDAAKYINRNESLIMDNLSGINEFVINKKTKQKIYFKKNGI